MPAIERIYPHGEPENFKRHIARYAFARGVIEQDLQMKNASHEATILDFMCGSGYGSEMLSRTGLKVIGFDRDAEAVQYATAHYGGPRVSFLRCDWKETDVLLHGRRFDYVVCLEGIEHVKPDDTAPVIRCITQFLQGPQTLIVSTPCAAHDGQSPINEFHINTFTPKRYEETLRERFSRVAFYKQDAVDYIHRIDTPEIGFVIGVCKGVK